MSHGVVTPIHTYDAPNEKWVASDECHKVMVGWEDEAVLTPHIVSHTLGMLQ